MIPSLPASISIKDLTFRYGDRLALEALSLDIPAGQIFGLLGPNGSGKTTLFRLLSTIAPVQSGSITIDGLDVRENPSRVRQRLGVVFQSPALDIHLTALENLTHHGHLYGLRGPDLRTRAVAALTSMGLADRAGEYVRTFSGGMKRRVELAKSLLHSPRVLLLDEPSTGLDPAARLELWTHLRSAAREHGVTLLLSTHLMDEAEKCDHLAVMSKGKIVAQGTPESLKQQVGNEVLRLTPRDLPAAQTALKSLSLSPTTHEHTLRLEHPGAHRLIPQLVELLGPNLLEISLGQPTLEDVFLHLTGESLSTDQGAELPPAKSR